MIFCKREALSRYLGLSEGMDAAIRFILGSDLNALPPGRNEISGLVYANRFDYVTQPEEGLPYETHLREIDVHLPLSGREMILVSDADALEETERHEDADYFLSRGPWQCRVAMTPEDALIVFPGEAHKVKCIADKSCPVKKLVVKVPDPMHA